MTRRKRNLAQKALDLAQGEPARAIELAMRALESPVDPREAATAWWALGLAKREIDDLVGAAECLRTAIETAESAGEAPLAAEVTSSLAWTVARMGDLSEALRLTDLAARSLTGGPAARNEMQKALILQRLGDNRRALQSYAVALEALEAAGDRIGAARLRINRSILHVYSGDPDAAVADLEEAHRISVEEEQTLLQAACAHNLGFAHGRRRDIPQALMWFDRAEEIFTRLGAGERMAALLSDRAEVYADVGLMHDALADARAAVDYLRREGQDPALADALLVLASIADLAGDTSAAQQCAAEARQLFASQKRRQWELKAAYAEALAALRGTPRRRQLRRMLSLVSRLDAAGWEWEATRARIEAGRVAFDLGDMEATEDVFGPVATTSGPESYLDRVARAEARYMLSVARGAEREARRAVTEGLRLLDRFRAGLGSPEMRAGIARHGVRLVTAAIDDAMRAGRPWRVLEAVETWRARSIDFPPVLPPKSTEVTTALAALRDADTALRQAGADGRSTDDIRAEIRRLETRIRRLIRQAEGDDRSTDNTPLDRASLTAALEGQALISYFSIRDVVHAVWYDGDRWRLSPLVGHDEIASAVDSVVFSLTRLASGQGSEASQEAAAMVLDETADQLARALVGPLDVGDRDLVIVPTGVLHRLPWHVLNELKGRRVSLAPSVRSWLRATQRLARIGPESPAALVAGPDLESATIEVDRLSRLYRTKRRLSGRNAKVDAVLNALDGVEVAHLAAHGTFRADNPQFSSLRLADGPLTVYDLDLVSSVPSVMIMPSCDSAVSEVGVGDELLGLSATLLRMGVTSLVAPTVPIPDRETTPLMVELHRRMLSGEDAAAALARVTSVEATSHAERAARTAFVALGA
ncbi:MAG TPA: CHAT domain-containing tetratricopeptide repeat protein [Acidimicrobiia bacterium]